MKFRMILNNISNVFKGLAQGSTKKALCMYVGKCGCVWANMDGKQKGDFASRCVCK